MNTFTVETYPKLQRGRGRLHWTPSRRPVPTSAVFEIRDCLRAIDLARNRPMSAHDAVDLQLFNRKALDNMITGHANAEGLGICVNALNLTLLLCEMGFGEEWTPTINLALEGAFRAKMRGERSGKWGFDGPAMAAIKDAIEVHELQLEHATRGELLEAIARMRRRIEEGNVYSAEPAES